MRAQVTFLGAAGTVTGSKYFSGINETRLLVDCGRFQGLKRLRKRNWRMLPIDAARLDAVALTHAHLDHSGYLPVLIRHGFKGPMYCTGGARGHPQEEDARYANKEGASKHGPVRIGVRATFAGDAYDLLRVVGAARVGTPDTIVHESNLIDASAACGVALEGPFT